MVNCNHFIEFGRDENDNVWITIHTGSRNLGQQICKYHTNVAKDYVNKLTNTFNIKDEIEKIKNDKSINSSEYQKLFADLKLKHKSISDVSNDIYLEGSDLEDYLIDMVIGQVYAETNRREMMKRILDNFNFCVIDEIESVHNYIDFEDNMIRKGAIRAHKNEKLIIPWNMSDGLIIGIGRSNPDWNYSAPHGAGRVMSRSQAKRELSMEVFKEQMKDIYSTSVVESTIDEAPNVYKNHNMIEDAIIDTVEILHNVKPIINIKSI